MATMSIFGIDLDGLLESNPRSPHAVPIARLDLSMRSSTKISWKTRGNYGQLRLYCRLMEIDGGCSFQWHLSSWMPAWAFSLAIMPLARQAKPGKWMTMITTSTLQKSCPRNAKHFGHPKMLNHLIYPSSLKKMVEKRLQPQLDWSFSTTSHGKCVPRLAHQRQQTSRRVDPHGRKATS